MSGLTTVSYTHLDVYKRQPQNMETYQQSQKTQLGSRQSLTQQRTGNQSISDKFSELNNLLASGTGIDTFGNTGDTRIPAQHTKTGTFINSQGTGYKQISNDPPKHNPFLATQYTGIPSSSIVPSYTGYGFGNQSSQQNNSQNGVNLIDL